MLFKQLVDLFSNFTRIESIIRFKRRQLVGTQIIDDPVDITFQFNALDFIVSAQQLKNGTFAA